jgi:hypothetical protein
VVTLVVAGSRAKPILQLRRSGHESRLHTHGSSYPVSEKAVAMMMIGLCNAGSLFRRMIAGEIIPPTLRDFSWASSPAGALPRSRLAT